MKKLLIAIVAIVVLGLVWGMSTNNSLVGMDEAASSQWANVQSSYQRRADLIPNLVNAVKGYTAHEQGTFTEVTQARANATNFKLDANDLSPENLKKFQELQGNVGSALSRLMMIQESYPELKADKQFLNLQDELAGTENRINLERNRFNDQVKSFNTSIRKFPRSIIASMLGFEKKAYFEATAESQAAPKVEF